MGKKEEKTLEELMNELEKISKELESENISLEDTIEKFKKGSEIAKLAEKKLNEAEKNISVIMGEGENEEEVEFTNE